MPLSFIVGLNGMNFKNMPELERRYGYPAVLLLMTVAADDRDYRRDAGLFQEKTLAVTAGQGGEISPHRAICSNQ